MLFYFRETVDLVYGDINSPFDDDVVMIPTNKEFKGILTL
jgi:hypothetical protein